MTGIALFCGEDSLRAPYPTGMDVRAVAAAFRRSGYWEEVVPGMADLTVKYDPATMTGEEAEARFRHLWDMPLAANTMAVEPAILAASFDDAPDGARVAQALNIEAAKLSDWLCSRTYRVTMMGFQPGFSYLEDLGDDDLPSLPRLETPRQRVTAGSIGFLGKRACIYALGGPGGWPIVGRIGTPLFRRDNPQPFLLQPGQIVRFRSA